MFEIIYFVGLIIMYIIRRPYQRQLKTDRITERHRPVLEIVLLSVMFVGMLVIPLIYVFTPLLGFADYKIPSWAGWIGTVITVLSLWFFWRSHVDLGRNWSYTLELRKDHQLITDGVYKHVRHPMYAASLMWVLPQGLLLHNWIAGFSPLLSLVAMVFLRMPHEEQMMLDYFGEEYKAYMKRTGRLLPHWFRK